MNDSAVASTASAPAAPGVADAGGSPRADLRRFHHGDPRSRGGELPAGILPAALHPFRGVAASGDWPLVATVASEPLARSLGAALAEYAASASDRVLADNSVRLTRAVARLLAGGVAPLAPTLAAAVAETAPEIELPAAESERLASSLAAYAATAGGGATVCGYGTAAVWWLADLAARRAARRSREALAGGWRELVGAADALLAADADRRPQRGDGTRAGRLGALGGRFFDAGRLAEVVAHRNAGEPLDGSRRAELERARARLAEFALDGPAPLWIVPHNFGPLGLGAGPLGASGGPPGAGGGPFAVGGTPLVADDPCAEACAAFDRAAAAAAELVRAARRVALEIAGAFDAERHLPGLERLDWRAFEAGELGLVPPVFAVVRSRDLLASGLQSLTRLLLSGRPIQVVVPTGDGFEQAAPSLARFEPGYLGLGHREVYVHQGSIARGAALAAGLAQGLGAARPALHVLDLPSAGPAELDPWWVASARVSGRAAPLFRYEPEAGASWARRLRFDDNPEVSEDWPREPLPAADGSGAPAEAPFTYADAALLDPAWRSHFALAAAGGDELLPLADWLEAPPEATARTLPFVWGASERGELVRLVVTRTLAWATRDRRGLWRTLEELAGVRSEHLDEAVGAARREAEERAAREREETAARHAAELERVRTEAAAGAVQRIVAGLMGGDGELLSGLDWAVAPAATPLAAAPAGETPAAAEATAEATPAPVAEAWVDSALCTSCDECTRKYPSIFAYNTDKQAYMKNPHGGAYRDLVRAAEACPARVIHPGEPWNPQEKDLAAWVARGRKFE